MAPLSGLGATIIGDGEMGIEQGLAEVLAVGKNMGVKAEVFIPAQIAQLDLMGTSQDGFSEALGFSRELAFAGTLPMQFWGVDADWADGDLRAEDRRQSRERKRAGVAVMAPVEEDHLRGG